MKTLPQISKELNVLKDEIRNRIKSYSFDAFVPERYYRLHFTHDNGIQEKEMTIQEIVYVGSNVTIYPRSNNYLPHSENTIEDIHDLFLICSLIEEHVDVKNNPL